MRRAEIPIHDRQGRTVGTLGIEDRAGASIAVLSESEAASFAEETTQLQESNVYDYSVSGIAGGQLDESEIVQPSRTGRSVGRLEPGLYTGRLSLTAIDSEGREVGAAHVEVRSRKIAYRSEYRHMLNRLTDAAVGLVMNIRAPVELKVMTDPRMSAASAHQRFAFARSVLQKRELAAAVEYVLRSAHRRWSEEDTVRDVRAGFRVNSRTIRQLVAAPRRVAIDERHPLFKLFDGRDVAATLPSTITDRSRTETLDTPENQFVKFALEEFQSFLAFLDLRFRTEQSAERRLRAEIKPLRARLDAWLAHGMFREIGPLRLLPLSSPVLQRRPGYREILRAWLAFHLACRLDWAGGEDAFAGGSRDVAKLYEYWVFFELLEIAQRVFQFDRPVERELVELGPHGIDLRLRRGQTLRFRGRFAGGDRDLNVEFNYNRTFRLEKDDRESYLGIDRHKSYPERGSWTRTMQPDFTIAMWPSGYDIGDAEREELVAYVHFDAKYRVEELTELFGTDEDPGSDDDEDRGQTAAKRSDLLKMHAYRDAIRRSEGAYVLYPGRTATENIVWYAYHEVVPGLGAFALRPGAEDANRQQIEEFIREVAEHVTNRATRREQLSYHAFRIEEPSGRYRSNAVLPDFDDAGKRLRPRPPSEAD